MELVKCFLVLLPRHLRHSQDMCIFWDIFMFVFVLDNDLWAKYKPMPVEIKTGSVNDYYDVFEEIGS